MLTEVHTLSDNFKSLFVNKENCDTTLLVQGKEFKAHEVVLVARSTVFADIFQHDTSVKQTRVITIPDCDSGTFQQFLEFIYCGKLEKISFCSATHLYETSHKYGVQELKAFCVDSLAENMTEENFREVVILADKYGDARLFSAVQGFFSKDPSKIMDTIEWKCLLENNYDLAKELLKGMATKFNELDTGNYKYDDEV